MYVCMYNFTMSVLIQNTIATRTAGATVVFDAKVPATLFTIVFAPSITNCQHSE